MIDFSTVREGDRIEYIADSFAYGGFYTVVTAESTYRPQSNCPEHERGKLMIVEITNSDLALFVTLDRLNPNDWKLAHREMFPDSVGKEFPNGE
jgi:hypothetical protein